MDVANTFRDLNVYKLAAKSAAEIYEMARAFPKEELFSLADQIRRSSRATKAMIAEAWTLLAFNRRDALAHD
jgi:four helix bundle protein